MLNQSHRSVSRLAAASLHRHILQPNRAAKISVAVFIHSWSNSELGALLDRLYQPERSLHEPQRPGPPSLLSQHRSMRRVLALVPQHYSLVMVSRLDLLFYSDLRVAALPGWRPGEQGLWLPGWCQDVQDFGTREMLAVQATCGCAVGRQRHKCMGVNGMGSLLEAPTLRRHGMKPLAHATEEQGLAVLDYWFVATRAVADGISRIAVQHSEYSRGLAALVKVADWAHFYWAFYVTRVLPSHIPVYFVMLKGRDFNLARFVRFGVDCEVPLPTRARPKAMMTRAAVPRSSRREPNSSAWLSEQCPSHLRDGSHMMCPWYTPGCEHRVVDQELLAHRVVRTIRGAELSQQRERLRPPTMHLDRTEGSAVGVDSLISLLGRKYGQVRANFVP